ncbi:crosslink repair DNA glycosylase YcaQ family protein [Brevibacterium daeguense]|uniref:Crosslink repair DNA glycosylase YcaQ family protein n=2 Tax=Brevibacterium daeguense TaxID=909936 RepID=A0ABP8EJS0_9MICO
MTLIRGGPTALTRAELLRLRMRSQGLVRSAGGKESQRGAPALGTPAAAAERLFAWQGQDLGSALWALGVRAPGTTREEVRAAFTAGRLVRSWPFRGTLHALAAADLPWILELTGPRTLGGLTRRNAELGITEATVDSARALASELLRGRKHASRRRLLDAFEDGGLATAGRGSHLISRLALEGTLVFGPFAGGEHQLVLVDEWITESRRFDTEGAVREIVRRYLAGRGPAALSDLAWWAKLPVRWIRSAAMELGDELTTFDYQGTELWGHAPALDSTTGLAPRQVLLPAGFDEVLLGYADRSAVLPAEHAGKVVPGGNGIFKPAVLVRGRAIGTWRAKPGARQVSVAVIPFERPPADRIVTAIRTQARAYAAYLGLDLAELVIEH